MEKRIEVFIRKGHNIQREQFELPPDSKLDIGKLYEYYSDEKEKESSEDHVLIFVCPSVKNQNQ